MSKEAPTDRTLSKLRVGRAMFVGIEGCLTDAARRLRAGELGLPAVAECLIEAATLAKRGRAKLEEVAPLLVQILTDAGVPPRANWRPGRQSRRRSKTIGPKRDLPAGKHGVRRLGISAKSAAGSQRKRQRR